MLRALSALVLVAFLFASGVAGDENGVAGDRYEVGEETNLDSVNLTVTRTEESQSAAPVIAPTGSRIGKGESALAAAAGGGTSHQSQGRRLSIFIPECWDGMVEKSECKAAPEEGTSAAPTASAAAPTRAEVETLVRSLVSRLEVPVPTPSVGPDPSVNEWDMAVVGYPLWLWTDTPASMDSSVSGYGITITMNARRVSTTFDMGDGNKVTCARMTAYPRSVKPATPSPTCGYVYSWPSLPKGNYTVTATSRWEVAWSAVGFSGTLPLSASASRELPVGELHAVVVR